ncbi:hypothetical protein AB7M59_003551 [Bradyrhizobium elkanii]|jgi:hypothetical protein
MSRKGHFMGGGTAVGPRDPTWFSKGSTRRPPNDSAPRPPLSTAEEAAFQAFKEERESGSRLIRKGEAESSKKRFRKTKPAKQKSGR